jgi:hypothetical protein
MVLTMNSAKLIPAPVKERPWWQSQLGLTRELRTASALNATLVALSASAFCFDSKHFSSAGTIVG